MVLAPTYYSLNSTSIEIADPAAAEDINKNVFEFIYNPKSAKDKHKHVYTFKLAKWEGKVTISCLVRKLGPIEYEC